MKKQIGRTILNPEDLDTFFKIIREKAQVKNRDTQKDMREIREYVIKKGVTDGRSIAKHINSYFKRCKIYDDYVEKMNFRFGVGKW